MDFNYGGVVMIIDMPLLSGLFHIVRGPYLLVKVKLQFHGLRF